MNVYAPIILCFVPFVTMFALFAILVPKISVVKELVASLAGLLALIPITLVQFMIPGMSLFGQSSAGGMLLYSIVFLGLVEECFKALLLFIVGAKEEKLSCWFCYSLLAGMIFGSFESVIYLLLNIQKINHGILPLNLIYLRMFTAVLIHTLCAGLGGFAVYYFKNLNRNLKPLIQAILIHGLYDYFVSIDTSIKYFSVIVILLAAMDCRVYYLKIAEELLAKKSAKRTAIDPNKTIEMPKNPAIIIPVNNTVRESVAADDVADEDSVDFDQIEREAKSQLKAAKKAPAKKTATKKTESKTAKRAASSASKKTSAKPKTSAAKAKAPAKKAAPKKTAKPAKSTAKTKTASKPKTAAKKPAAKTKAKGKR